MDPLVYYNIFGVRNTVMFILFFHT